MTPMTRNEARMIAEEFFKLCKKNDLLPQSDRYLNVREAAQMLGLSAKTVYNKLAEIPHTKVGGTLRFSERSLRQYIERT